MGRGEWVLGAWRALLGGGHGMPKPWQRIKVLAQIIHKLRRAYMQETTLFNKSRLVNETGMWELRCRGYVEYNQSMI